MPSGNGFAREAAKHAEVAARHITEDPRDMRIAEVSACVAQAYAALAQFAACPGADVVEPYVHDGHDTPREASYASGAGVSDDALWEQIKQVSWRWGEEERREEWEAYFGFPVQKAGTANLVEFLRVVRYLFPRLVPARYALPGRDESGIDYSDLRADVPSETVDAAWVNVGAYLAQQDRALSSYTVHPDVNVEIADEITPTHVLRWSSLRVLYAEHERQDSARADEPILAQVAADGAP